MNISKAEAAELLNEFMSTPYHVIGKDAIDEYLNNDINRKITFSDDQITLKNICRACGSLNTILKDNTTQCIDCGYMDTDEDLELDKYDKAGKAKFDNNKKDISYCLEVCPNCGSDDITLVAKDLIFSENYYCYKCNKYFNK